MAIVPRKVEADVSLAPLTGARYAAPQRTGGLDVANSVARFGGALGAFAEAQDQIDASLDATGARTLDTQAMGQLNSIQTDFMSKRGLQAGIARPDAEKAVADARTALLAKATTPRMKKMVGTLLDQRSQAVLNAISAHSVGQLQIAGDESLKARFGMSAETAISATDPDEREKNIQTGLGDIARLGESQGWSPEVLEGEKLKYRSGINRGVIRNLIDADNVTGAIAYRDAHSKELTADDDAMIDGMLRDPIQTRQANADLTSGMAAISGGVGVGGKPEPGAAAGASPATGTTTTPGLTAPKVPTSVSADVIFNNGLIPQESGGRPGIAGPSTQYGTAHGLTQLLDGTGAQMAKKLGVPWRPDLLRGTSTEAINYQKQLGRAYFNQGLDKYDGDVRKALMYYHGGPNEAIWGPKTHAYADKVMRRVGLDPGTGGTTNSTGQPASGADLEKLDGYFDAEVSAGRMSPERADRAKNLARQRLSLSNAVRSQKENDAERAALDTIDKLPGQKLTDWAQIPAEIRANLSPETRVRYDQMIAANLKKEGPQPNGDAVVNLHQLMYLDPQKFLSTDLRTYRSQMTPSEYDELSTQWAKMAKTPQGQSDGSAVWSTLERYGPDLGIDMAPLRKGESEEQFRNRRADGMKLYNTIQARLHYITGGTRDATPDEVKGAFDYSVMGVQRVTKGTLWGENTENLPFYRTQQGDKLRTAIPDNVRARIMSAYGQRNMKLTEQQIMQIYLNNKGKQGYW